MHAPTTTPNGPHTELTVSLNYLVEALLNPDQPVLAEGLQSLQLSDEKIQKILTVRAILQQHTINQQVTQQVAKLQLQSHLNTSAQETFATISKIKEGLSHSIQSSRRIQTWTAVMYLAMFCLGFALVITGAFFAKVEGTNDWFTITFGASGLVLLLAVFLTNPPRELQRVRANYVQLSILALGWFNELVDSGGVRQYTSSLAEYSQLSKDQTTITQQYMQMMERYAEPRGKGDVAPLIQAVAQEMRTGA